MFDTNNSTVCWFLWFWYPAFTLDPRSFLFFLEGSYTSSSWIGCLDVEEMKCVVLSTLGFTKRVRFGSLTSWITYIVPKFLIYARKIITKPHFFALRSYNSTTHNLRYWSEAYIFFGLHNQHCHHLPLSDRVLPHVKSRERQSFFLWKKQCVQNDNFIVKPLDRLL